METWLVDVKRVRIPRPKFGSSGRCYVYPPTEPPKDYLCEEPQELKLKNAMMRQNISLAKATEDLRRAIQDKL